MPALYLFNQIGFFLERILVPQLRKTAVNAPVFIIGHPRSGTTFLHRLLTQTDDFVVFKAWEMIFPSLLGRVLIGPIIAILTRLGLDEIYPKKVGHELRLNSIEEEEVLFLQNLDTQFVTLVSTRGLDPGGFSNLVFNDEQPHQLASVEAFKTHLQRQVFLKGKKKRIVAKPNYSVMRIKTLLKVFPDAKFIYIARSPLESIPSHLSLHHAIIDHVWGVNHFSDQVMSDYVQRRLAYNMDFYHYYETLKKSNCFSAGQLLEVPYSNLKENLWETLQTVFAFANITPSKQLVETLIAQDKQQKSYVPSHKNKTLADFGLSEVDIKNKLPQLFDNTAGHVG
jgi:hypothetical protein